MMMVGNGCMVMVGGGCMMMVGGGCMMMVGGGCMVVAAWRWLHGDDIGFTSVPAYVYVH